jgi:hypothetical protein
MSVADEISQAERRRIIAWDRRSRTYFGQAQHTDDDLGGRYAKVHSTTITGSGPISYPDQPSTSPWHHDACPPEPPLGFSVEEMEPVGEPFQHDPPSTTAFQCKRGKR